MEAVKLQLESVLQCALLPIKFVWASTLLVEYFYHVQFSLRQLKRGYMFTEFLKLLGLGIFDRVWF